MMREHVGMVSSRVRVGSTGTVFGHLLSPVLASFIKTYPKIHLDLIERDDTLLEEGVFNGELDCASHHSLGLFPGGGHTSAHRGDPAGGQRRPPGRTGKGRLSGRPG